MDFTLSAFEDEIKDTFRRFADEVLAPQAAEIDELGEFPREPFLEVARLGFFGMRYPESVGGLGLSRVAYCLAIEEIARASLSVAASCAMQSLMGTHFVYRSGNQELLREFFAPALEGNRIGTICMTEPDAGSDLKAIRTRAVRDGEEWVLSGQKTWVTSAPVADFFTVFARTDAERSAGLSIFLVPRDAPGLVVGRKIEKLGVRASPTSEVVFDECRIPERFILCEEGQAEGLLKEVLAEIRIMTGALACGVAQAALDEAVRYAKQREQFGRAIGKFQAVRLPLGEAATDLVAARQLVRYAAWTADQGPCGPALPSMAKLFASEAAVSVCDKAARVLASYGFATEFPVERFLRDVRFTLIGGGTSEILKLTVARSLEL
ncbi:MAG: acyl-CoA dehydrogenase [Planctomycetes bacterium]|nr:acyl-CoA dehydrogenase [Planctomycetota bacterium]